MSAMVIDGLKRRPKLYMTLGLSGSGKTTWAIWQIRRFPPGALVRVNKDALRLMVHDGRYAGHQTESQILALRNAMVLDMLRRKVDVIVDDTNLHVSHENALRGLAAEAEADFELIDFTAVPIEVCIARDARREGAAKLGAEVIQRQAKDLSKRKVTREPLSPRLYRPDPELPGCIMVDFDGTLALKGERSPYDWGKVLLDGPNQPVVELVQALAAAGETVIVLSGRDESCRADSQKWLGEYVSPGLQLIMREANDQRRDDIVKLELFDRYIRDRYRVKFVLDDRQRVVDAWRRVLGLTVFQVAAGDFDIRPMTVAQPYLVHPWQSELNRADAEMSL